MKQTFLLVSAYLLAIAAYSQNLEEVKKVLPSDVKERISFGTSVAISGQYAIIGSDNAAYIFKQETDSWNEVKKIETTGGFGNSVSISGDYAIVGDGFENITKPDGTVIENVGAAYILQNIDGTWKKVQKITNPNGHQKDFFGQSVDISGNHAVVGTSMNSAFLLENINGKWQQVKKLEPADTDEEVGFGRSVAIAENHVIVGAELADEDAERTGSAYIFEKTEGKWNQAKKLANPDGNEGDFFGASVDITDDFAIVGAYGNEAAYIFKNDRGNWTLTKAFKPTESFSFGISVSISKDYAAVGAYRESGNNVGAAYFYKYRDGTWTQMDKIAMIHNRNNEIEVEHFGYSIANSENFFLVGAPNTHLTKGPFFWAGIAYLYQVESD